MDQTTIWLYLRFRFLQAFSKNKIHFTRFPCLPLDIKAWEIGQCENNSSMIEFNELCELEDDHVSEEVVQILQMARDMSLSTRNMLKLERQCTRRELLTGRDKLLQYVAATLEVSSGVVSRRSAAVCPLVQVVQSQFTLSRACGTFSVTRQDRVLVIIGADATPLWQTSATKCNVHVTIWSEGVAAAGDVRHSATWWTLDGPEDTHCLRAIDIKGTLINKFWACGPLWMFGT